MTPSRIRRRAAVATGVAAVALAVTVGGSLPAVAASSTVLYVAPTGSDSNAGTAASPLRTPQVAVDKLGSAGGTVQLAGGTYAKQRIVLTNRADVTVRAAAGATPVLDATGLTPANDLSGLVQITNSTGISIQGLDLTGYRTTSTAKTPAGIVVTGSGANISLTGNHVHHLGNHNATKGSMDMNAHGIAVYGTNASAAITNVTISGNEVDNLKLGASEAVVVNGNVDGWAIDANRVHDNNNIGIDAIGYETTISGSARYTDVNRARNGRITNNTVSGISANGNPAYWENGSYCRCADGIYVDGGRDIVISGNTVSKADIGLEVAAEDPKGKTNGITVQGNTVTGSAYVGLAIGGYAAGRGEAYDVHILNNTFSANNGLNDGSPEVLLQFKIHETEIRGNRITAGNVDDPVLVWRVKQAGTAAQNANLVIDGNDYGSKLAASDASFVWLGKVATGFSTWRTRSGQDATSTYTVR